MLSKVPMNLLSALREFWVKLVGGSKGTPVSPEYSYRIFWVKQGLDWDKQKRAQVHAEIQTIISDDRFVANNYKRQWC